MPASSEQRLKKLEENVAELASDLRVLRSLVKQDHGSALNKIRYVTEKVLHELCASHDVSWGKQEPTLENMIGPLIATKVIPKNVALHVRTVQTNASPGSHYQESPLSDSHVQLAQTALLEFLDWYYGQREGKEPPSSTTAAAPKRASRPPYALALGLAVVAVAAAFVAVRVWPRASVATTAPASASAPPSATAASLRSPEVGLRALDTFHSPKGSLVALLDSRSFWESCAHDFEEAVKQPGAPARWSAGQRFCEAEAELVSSKTDAAADAFRKASALDATWSSPHAGLAIALVQGGSVDPALAEAREAERVEPSWAGAVWTIARVDTQADRLTDAIQEYRRALTMAPDDVAILADFALVLHAARLDGEADRIAKRALEKDPDLVSVHVMLAERALEANDAKGALDHATHALAGDPNSAPARLAEADALVMLGRNEEALVAYKQAVEAWDARHSKGAGEIRMKDVRAAVAANRLPPGRTAKSHIAHRTACAPGDPLCSTL